MTRNSNPEKPVNLRASWFTQTRSELELLGRGLEITGQVDLENPFAGTVFGILDNTDPDTDVPYIIHHQYKRIAFTAIREALCALDKGSPDYAIGVEVVQRMPLGFLRSSGANG